MKRTLCAVALAIACAGLAAPPAQADTPRCVTKAEYRHVGKGMTKRRVHRVFDNRGRRVVFARTGRWTSEVRTYRTCRRRGAVSVSYTNGRLATKAAVRR